MKSHKSRKKPLNLNKSLNMDCPSPSYLQNHRLASQGLFAEIWAVSFSIHQLKNPLYLHFLSLLSSPSPALPFFSWIETAQ